MSSDTTSHDEAIGQFCGVTGADEERAKGLLEACDWNLELAINMHVDTDDGRANNRASTSSAGPSTSASAAPLVSLSDSFNDEDDDTINIDVPLSSRTSQSPSVRPNSSRQAQDIFDPDHVRPPIPPVRQVLVPNTGFSESDLTTARRSVSRGAAASQVYDAFRDFQAEAQWQEMVQGESSDPSGLAASASAASNAHKSRTLQELFRPPLDLIFRGSLASAREAGSIKNKWLLVNIQDGREFPCQILNRDVWSNQTVKDILKEHFIFWQVDHNTVEGSKYIQFYKVKRFPHVSIIDPRTGELMKFWPTTIDHNSFCDSVIEFLTEHPSLDGSSDSNSMKKLCVKEEQDASAAAKTLYDQSEEAQLEAAIKASLKDSENSNSSKAFHDEDSFTDALESETDQNTQSSFSARVFASSSISSSNAFASKKEKKDDNEQEVLMKKKKELEVEDYKKYLGTETTKFSDLIVRFPDGSRQQLTFPSDSLLKALFLLLKSKGFGTEHYNYVTNFPRRLLHELPNTATLQDAKLIRETIFVEKRMKDD